MTSFVDVKKSNVNCEFNIWVKAWIPQTAVTTETKKWVCYEDGGTLNLSTSVLEQVAW